MNDKDKIKVVLEELFDENSPCSSCELRLRFLDELEALEDKKTETIFTDGLGKQTMKNV